MSDQKDAHGGTASPPLISVTAAPALPPVPVPAPHVTDPGKLTNSEEINSRIRASISVLNRTSRMMIPDSMASLVSMAASVRYDMFKDVHQLTLSIHPLDTQFNEFAGITERKTGDLKIDLFGIEAWFRQAKIFMKMGGARISAQDVKSIFYRMSKESLSFKEFETFIEALADFRKMHPDTIVYRLRLCGNPELESRFVHVTLPEGSVDRLIDGFRDSAKSITETFYDTSTKPYEEPICRGGVRRRFQEEQIMFEKDVARIERAQRMESLGGLDRFRTNFVSFAKDRDFYSDGRRMTVTNLIKWMKQAGVINGTDISSTDIAYLYKKLYTLDQQISVHDVTHFLNELAQWKNDDAASLLRKLRFCTPPARSSITVVKMEVPEDVVQCFKDTLLSHADEFYDVRDLYTPTSADTAYGHTPKSRDRFFQDDVDTKGQKISNLYTKHSKQQNAMAASATKATAKKPEQRNMIVGANPEDQFQTRSSRSRSTLVEGDSNDNRSKKFYFTKRWSEAYPYGGHEAAYKAVRLDPEIQRYLVNLPEREESLDDIEIRLKKEKMREKFGLKKEKEKQKLLQRSLRRQTALYEDISFEEQFKTFSSYLELDEVSGISRQNGALWILQSHIIDNVLLTVEDVQQIEHKYFKDVKHLPIERFKVFTDELADKRKMPSSEVNDRLRRCGKPTPETIVYKSFTEAMNDRKSFRRQSTDEPEKNKRRRSSAESNVSYMETLFEGDPELKALFAEYARFGEPVSTDGPAPNPQISPRNIDKWFKQTKLFGQHKLAPAEPNVFYKQLFHHAQHITYIQFYDLLDAISESKKLDLQFYIDALKEGGSPALTTTSALKSPVSEVYDRIKQVSIQINPQDLTARRTSKGIDPDHVNKENRKSSIRIRQSQIQNTLHVPSRPSRKSTSASLAKP